MKAAGRCAEGGPAYGRPVRARRFQRPVVGLRERRQGFAAAGSSRCRSWAGSKASLLAPKGRRTWAWMVRHADRHSDRADWAVPQLPVAMDDLELSSEGDGAYTRVPELGGDAIAEAVDATVHFPGRDGTEVFQTAEEASMTMGWRVRGRVRRQPGCGRGRSWLPRLREG